MRYVPGLASILTLVLAVTAGPTPAAAQSSYCSLVTLSEPQRSALRCSGGVFIEIERTALTNLETSMSSRVPKSLDVDRGGVLIELEPGERTFQIQTPHAIAAARGTIYVVDVDAAETDVFVARGDVSVTRTSDGAQVMLGAGEGVDVIQDGPLVVKQWGAARVEALMSRFGR